VWAKREDVSSGLAFGGNKTRKLEYIVPDVLAQGADTLVSIGASSPTTPGRWRRSRRTSV
jgi:1-aminocyclopropane-1-carboxylate deaminase/D-cysteine desulfhydrase-like pyridoxal-dependent ACC family enzyme